jgi:hypothetical protein
VGSLYPLASGLLCVRVYMDILTQPLLNALKKFSDVLKRTLDLLNKQNESTNKIANATIKQSTTPIVVTAECKLSEATIDKVVAGIKPNEERENLKLRLESWTVALLLMYTIVTGFEWYELNTSNLNQSAATIGANATANMELYNQRHQLAMEQRAWVVFDTDYVDKNFRPKLNESILIPIELLNIGKTPATNIDGVVIVEELKRQDEPTFDYRPGRPRNLIKNAVLYPGFPATSSVRELNNEPLSDTRYRSLRREDKVLKVHGQISYEDVFHVHHLLTFCHVIGSTPSTRSPMCVEHNGVDPNAE